MGEQEKEKREMERGKTEGAWSRMLEFEPQ